MSDPVSPLDHLNSSSMWLSWSVIWTQFQDLYSGWWHQRIRHLAEPVYGLPEFVIRKLLDSRNGLPGKRRRRPLIAPADAEAERAFTAKCLEFSPDTVGVWNGNPISFNLLSPLEPFDDTVRSLWLSLGKSASEVDAICAESMERSTATRNQMLARTGFLLTSPQFLSERELLKNLWRQCPDATRMDLTLMELRTQPVTPEHRESVHLPESCCQFYEHLGAFLRRWELIRFATWDLPCVQGPLENVSPQTLCHLGRGNQTLDYTPGFFSQPISQNLRERLQNQQRDYGRREQFDTEYPQAGIAPRGLQVASSASIFKMWFIHNTVIRRYGRPQGLTVRLQEAFEEALDLSADRIRALQRDYIAFLSDVAE